MAKVILTQSNVQEYRNISNNFNQERFNAFAFEVQQTQLRELLRDPLYTALYNDLSETTGQPTAQKYVDLVDGKEYELDNDTIIYYGLRPFLAYHWLALNVREGDYFQADYGNIQFQDNPQDNMTKINQKTIDRINSAYFKNVTSYRNNIVEFLNENDSTYPEWEGRAENKPKTSFNTLTI